jgi:hypothetical protein
MLLGPRRFSLTGLARPPENPDFAESPTPEKEDDMARHLRSLALALAIVTGIAAAPPATHACTEPFPPNVGVALTSTPGGFELTLYGGTAFGSPMGAGCGCTVAFPLGAAFKLGCMIDGLTITDPDGNDIGFGTFAQNATTAASFSSYFDPAFNGAFSVIGFATTLANAIGAGQSLQLVFNITCTNPNDPKLRDALAGFLAHSAVIGTGPVMPDGSVEVGDPTHLGVTVASVNDKCQPAKKKCVAKKQDCLLKCHAIAEAKGLPVDPNCLSKCETKFDGGVNPAKGCVAKVEAKGGCMVGNQTASLEAAVDAFVLDVVQQLDPGYPAPVLNACSAAKKRCAGKKTAALLKCLAKAEQKHVPVDPNCVSKVIQKFSTCFAKAELIPPSCLTTGDEAAIEATIDTFANDVECQIDPSSCP